MENNKNHQALNAKPPITGSNVQIRSKSSPGKNTSLHDLAAPRLVKKPNLYAFKYGLGIGLLEFQCPHTVFDGQSTLLVFTGFLS